MKHCFGVFIVDFGQVNVEDHNLKYLLCCNLKATVRSSGQAFNQRYNLNDIYHGVCTSIKNLPIHRSVLRAQ